MKSFKFIIALLAITFAQPAFAQKAAKVYLTFTPLHDLPTRLVWPGTVTDGRYIYAVNGYIPVGSGYSADVLRYDPAADKWIKLGNKAGYKIKPAIAYAPNKQSAYIFGGTEFAGSMLFQGVQKLELSTGNVVKLKTSNPVATSQGYAAGWDNQIYVFGGTREEKHTISFLYSFDTDTEKFTQLRDMPESLETTGAIVNGLLYTFGGYDRFLSRQSLTISAYDIKTNTWAKVGKLPKAISDNCIAVYGNMIFIIGSYDHEFFLGYFNTVTKKFTELSSNLQGRHNAGAAVIGNKLYVFGGTSRFNPSVPGIKTVQVANLDQIKL